MKKWGILCIRSKHSQFGYAESWLKAHGELQVFFVEKVARQEAMRLNNESRSGNVSYSVKEMSDG